jgi:hypothetical protein
MTAAAAGIWLSMKVARTIAGARAVNAPERTDGAGEEPVREVVAEVLDEHRDEDTPIVHAFEEALAEEEAEEGVTA